MSRVFWGNLLDEKLGYGIIVPVAVFERDNGWILRNTLQA